MNASIPFHDTTPNVQDLSRHPVMVRIGSGDVYEGTVLRFAPNIQVARDGRLGDRLIFDDKKNFAPRIGWAWNPSDKWSYRAGTGIFYMQDTGNPRFDMARNLSGRRRDNTLLLTPDLTLDAPFRGSGAGSSNDCGVAPPLVCLTNVYILGNMPNRKTPYMFQYLFNIQRELDSSTALEVGYLGSRSYRLERMFDWNETIPGITGSVQSRKPYPEFTKVQEIGNVAEARYNSLAVKLTRRLHQVEHGRGPGSSERHGTGSGPAGRPAHDRAMVQHRCVCLERSGHLRQRRPQHLLRPGHLERGFVDHPELPDAEQNPAVPARGVQLVQQPDLERPEHDVDEPAVRHDHEHEKADAATAARSEIRLLSPNEKLVSW